MAKVMALLLMANGNPAPKTQEGPVKRPPNTKEQ